MISRRRVLLGVGGAVLIGALIAVLNIKGIRQAWEQRQHDREVAHLSQHVDEHMPQDWDETSSLVVRQIEYFGAGVVEYRWSKLGSQYRQYHGWPDAAPPAWSSPLQVDETATRAIWDAMNIAVRDRLWQRGDIRRKDPPSGVILDGGEVAYEFVLGPNRGTLRLIQGPNVPDLRLFEHKIRIWTEDVRRQLRHMASPQTSSADKERSYSSALTALLGILDPMKRACPAAHTAASSANVSICPSSAVTTRPPAPGRTGTTSLPAGPPASRTGPAGLQPRRRCGPSPARRAAPSHPAG